jgi:hypothetical protein
MSLAFNRERSDLMVKVREIRRLALSLPETSEAGHHGMPSFRVANKIVATIPDDEHLHVMVGPDETDMAVSAAPRACEKLWWGARLAGIRVNLAEADIDLITMLLTEAWRRKAPRRLARLFDSSKR